MREKTAIIVVDDHAIFRTGVIQILASSNDLDVVGEGASQADAIDLATRLRPNIALIDISMPGGGLEAARSFHSNCPDVRVVMLTVAEDQDVVLQALDAGVSGYVLKGVPGSELITIIRSIAKGETYVPPNMAVSLLSAMRGRIDSNSITGKLAALTLKERQTLRFLARGFSNRDIAEATGVSLKTVKFHVSNILAKLGSKNRVEAALIGQSHSVYDDA
ncbi:MAG TPA: response regulator transcription factor [Bosea sp. (in: a-proteobacteria)]|uniref:response regulator transcription factor n=1 Tax=Bosea sp. (in: a-proteobacteria) TaxID=1871050 RepID=UPI002E155980|nr:response regulator transcription factor [Bosea sp. (in: a-proteobacteria)]